MRNKLTRLGVILLTLGLSFIVLAIVRGGYTSSLSKYVSIPKLSATTVLDFWVPRDMELTINSPSGVDVNISDPAGTVLYSTKNVTVGSSTLNLEKRGTYRVTIYNPSDSNVNVKLDVTFYNFEKDLVLISLFQVITGITLIITQRIYQHFSQRRPSPGRLKAI